MILSKAINASRCWIAQPGVHLNLKNALNIQLIVRHGGGGPRMIRSKTIMNTGFRRLAVRYFFIGFIPPALIATYCNLFIGDAVLYDHDPEVYTPEYWEYYKHPITRFLAKYVMENPELSYFKDIYTVEAAVRDAKQTRLIQQVEHLQRVEQEGMIEWQTRATVPRASLDEMDEYVEKNLKK